MQEHWDHAKKHLLQGQCRKRYPAHSILLIADLSNMYALLMPIKGTSPLCQNLEAHIRKTGLQMVESLTTDNVSVSMLNLRQVLHSLKVLSYRYSVVDIVT